MSEDQICVPPAYKFAASVTALEHNLGFNGNVLFRLGLIPKPVVEREGEKCAVCSQMFRMNSRRIPCRNCGLEAHSGCSLLTIDVLRREDPYECRLCMRGDLLDPPPELDRQVADKGDRCSVCGVTLRRGAGCACCPRCNKKAHKKCINRRPGEWRCGECVGGPVDRAREVDLPRREDRVPDTPLVPMTPPPGQEFPAPEARNERCTECSTKLRKTADPLVCRACRQQYHVRLSALA